VLSIKAKEISDFYKARENRLNDEIAMLKVKIETDHEDICSTINPMYGKLAYIMGS
jgi:hypothetical protein